MTFETQHEPPPRRRAGRDQHLARQARDAAGPLVGQIAPWQASAIRLMTSGERLRERGEHDPEQAAEAMALDALVRSEAARFRLERSRLPANVAAHSRIVDLERALDSLLAITGRARQLLDV